MHERRADQQRILDQRRRRRIGLAAAAVAGQTRPVHEIDDLAADRVLILRRG
jgi:hypothetical protein